MALLEGLKITFNNRASVSLASTWSWIVVQTVFDAGHLLSDLTGCTARARSVGIGVQAVR
jgi:hypothetical protein